MSRRLARRLALVALLGGILGLPATGGSASAGCIGPTLVEPPAAVGVPQVPLGTPLTVRGEAFGGLTCDDTGSGGNGLGCRQADEEELEPMENVRLALRQDGRTWELGSADARDGGQISWDDQLPSQVLPGRAVLVADVGDASDAARLPVTVR